jgi:hypothetical protein
LHGGVGSSGGGGSVEASTSHHAMTSHTPGPAVSLSPTLDAVSEGDEDSEEELIDAGGCRSDVGPLWSGFFYLHSTRLRRVGSVCLCACVC